MKYDKHDVQCQFRSLLLFGWWFAVKSYLLDDIDGVMYLLPLQERVQVVQQVKQVSLSAAMRDEDGDTLPRRAVGGLVLAFSHLSVFSLHVLQFQRGLKGQWHSST